MGTMETISRVMSRYVIDKLSPQLGLLLMRRGTSVQTFVRPSTTSQSSFPIRYRLDTGSQVLTLISVLCPTARSTHQTKLDPIFMTETAIWSGLAHTSTVIETLMTSVHTRLATSRTSRTYQARSRNARAICRMAPMF